VNRPRHSIHWSRVCAFAALGTALGQPASGASPVCIARAELAPNVAVVGQQVAWRVEIEMGEGVREVSWVNPPAFAHARTERLPGQPGAPGAHQGRPTTTRVEARALFAERPGPLRIASDGLRCTLTDGRQMVVDIPEVVLEVQPLPDSDADGIVGPLFLETHLSDRELELGESLELTVSIRGAGNLWDIADPLPRSNAPERPEIFARTPELDLRPGVRLGVQRIFRYDVVPRSVGTLAIPAVELVYYDPATQAYKVARTPAKQVAVNAAAPPATRATPGDRAPASEPSAPADPSSNPMWPIAGAIAAVAIAFGFYRTRRPARSDPVLNALRNADRAAADGDAGRESAELANALRSALASHVDDPDADPPENASAPVVAACEVLRALERARFDRAAEPPQRSAVRAALRALPRAAL
jgi:hypothetical protein